VINSMEVDGCGICIKVGVDSSQFLDGSAQSKLPNSATLLKALFIFVLPKAVWSFSRHIALAKSQNLNYRNIIFLGFAKSSC
jgi:hypothetical protein